MSSLDGFITEPPSPQGPEAIPAPALFEPLGELGPPLPSEPVTIAPQELRVPPTNDLLRTLAEDSLFTFAKGILGYDWLNEEIHKPLCEMLEQYEANRRLVIVLPRSWLKTTLCSIAYPIWRAVRAKGNIRILLVQNTYDNAVAKLSSVKKQFEENQLLRALWPELLPRPGNVWKGDSLCLSRTINFPESTFECGGTRTQFISRHYDLIIEDDTVAPKLNEMGEENVIPVKEDIVQAIGFHSNCMHLQNDFEHSQIMVVGTRWFEKDLISTIWDKEQLALLEDRTYRFYFRSCLEGDKGSFEHIDGKADELGRPSYPSRMGEKVLKDLRKEIGPYMFSCLYLNKPVRSVDMLFQEQWFLKYDREPSFLHVFTTVDLGGMEEDTKGEPDPSVVLTTGKSFRTGRIYLLDYRVMDGNSPQEVIQELFDQVKRWKSLKAGVEKVGLQKMLLSFIREKMKDEKFSFSLVGIEHGKKTKQARIRGLQPYFSQGSIFIRHYHTQLVSQALAFPLGAHDDILDALAMQQEFWRAVRDLGEQPDNEVSEDLGEIMLGFRKPKPLSRVPSSLDLAERAGPLNLFDDSIPLSQQDLYDLSRGRVLSQN